jgi:hypothetical protein
MKHYLKTVIRQDKTITLELEVFFKYIQGKSMSAATCPEDMEDSIQVTKALVKATFPDGSHSWRDPMDFDYAEEVIIDIILENRKEWT